MMVMTTRVRVLAALALVAGGVLLLVEPASAHENQVIRLGSFLGGLLHPVLGLDHFLAMVSVGIVSSMVGGRAIWTIPALFVAMMGVGGLAGAADIGLTSTAIESGIAVSVIALGSVMALDRSLPARVVMGAIVFFGFFHGYAHGAEIPDIARPAVYASGFILGTALIHLLGVVVGEVARRYGSGRIVLRALGALFAIVGLLFMIGAL
jgi:urease accessory protein